MWEIYQKAFSKLFAKFRRPLPIWEQEILDEINAGNAKIIDNSLYRMEWTCGKYTIKKETPTFVDWSIYKPEIRFLTRRGKLAIISALRKQGLIDFQLFTVQNFIILPIVVILIISFILPLLCGLIP